MEPAKWLKQYEVRRLSPLIPIILVSPPSCILCPHRAHVCMFVYTFPHEWDMILWLFLTMINTAPQDLLVKVACPTIYLLVHPCVGVHKRTCLWVRPCFSILNIFQAVAVSILLYGCTIWTPDWFTWFNFYADIIKKNTSKCSFYDIFWA